MKREAEAEGKNHSTLIVLPPALVSQWQNEIVKCTGDALTVDYVDYKTGKITRRGNPDGDADIVLTTYKALEQASVAKILNEERWGRIVLVRDVFGSARSCEVVIICQGYLIVTRLFELQDEMQEVRSTTTKIAKTCEKLDCNRRWMLSGTPLFDGIDDLRGELNFLRLEPFSAGSEDGFFKFMISDPWEEHKPQAIETLKVLSSVMLRRSKSMTIKATGAPILGLKPLTVEFVPIQQTISERAIYYFLESIVARVLRSSPVTKGAKSSRRLCLRLLRDLCNSAVRRTDGHICSGVARRHSLVSFPLLSSLDIAQWRFGRFFAAQGIEPAFDYRSSTRQYCSRIGWCRKEE